MNRHQTLEAGAAAQELSPMLLAVLANRFDGVVREMTNTMLRTGRSAVINSARDFSCGITTGDNELFATAEGLPAHTYGLNLQTAAMCRFHDDIAEGDAYLHNDPYSGNSHPADHTLIVPVFWEGEHLFNVCAKAHQADIGNSLPSTYHAAARDLYEEGALIFPAVRVQRAHRTNMDIIRMCQRRIRVPDYWYGDFLSMLGAARTGEKRIHDIFRKYGKATIRRFVGQWFDYSESRMRQAIAALPAATIERESFHDPIPPFRDESIPVRVKITVEPEAGVVELDLTANIDCMDNGLNLSEACAISNSVAGIYNSLPADIPRNGGSYRCIRMKLREGAAIGIPRFPHSCSVATTNVSERLLNNVQAALAGRDDETLVLNRTGAQQRLPMRLAGLVGERRRHTQQLGTALRQTAIQLGKAQVVTHRQTQRADIGGHHDVGGLTRRDGARLAILIDAITTVDIDIEQMNLVVARNAPAAGAVDQRCSVDARIVAGHPHRHGAGDDGE